MLLGGLGPVCFSDMRGMIEESPFAAMVVYSGRVGSVKMVHWKTIIMNAVKKRSHRC